jgi:hypothetical protein
LEGCRYNPTIEWKIYTDDESAYDYPQNVSVKYCSLKEMRERIQSLYDFKISLVKPYKLCDYRVAYGEIFSEDLTGYDFWGYCDVDLVFGNIRKFLTEDILNKFEKIGFQGHLTLYKNKSDVNQRYKTIIAGENDYREIFSSECNYCFDESIIDTLYDKLNIPVYREVHFAHLLKYIPDFYLGHLPESDNKKNKHQIFTWEKGRLLRHYVLDGNIFEEEFMYIHFFCRKMKCKIQDYSKRIVIYPNTIENMNTAISLEYIKKHAHMSKIKYIVATIKRCWKKISIKKIWNYYQFSREQRLKYKI